jgi:ATP-dependent RNA helicase MSS116, mitochondrial
MTGGDLFLRAHAGVPVLTMAFPSRLHVPARSRRSSAFPLAAVKAGVVGRVRSGGYAAVQKRRRSDVQEARPFSRVVTKRDAVDEDEDEEDVEAEAQEFDAAESGDEGECVDGSYLSETRYCCTPCCTVLKFELQY